MMTVHAINIIKGALVANARSDGRLIAALHWTQNLELQLVDDTVASCRASDAATALGMDPQRRLAIAAHTPPWIL